MSPHRNSGADEARVPLDAAYQYTHRGWQILPVHYPVNGACSCGSEHHDKPRDLAKHPATAKGSHDASSDLEFVETWWLDRDWNIGMRCGAGSGVFAVDVDGPEGVAELEALEAEHGELPATFTTRSGRDDVSGHRVYAIPEGRVVGNRQLAKHVDVRGENGYLILPPSVHRSGRRYEIIDDRPPVDAPAWLLDQLEPAEAVPVTAMPTANVDLATVPARVRAIFNAPSDDTSKQMFRLAAACVDAGLDDSDTLGVIAAHQPSRDKYGDRLDIEACRAVGKLRATRAAERATDHALTTDGEDVRILPPPTQPLPVARKFIAADFTHDQGHLTVRAWRGGWWVWKRTKYAELEERAIRKAAYQFTEHAVYLSGNSFAPWAPTRHKITDVLEAAKAVTYLRQDIHQPEWIEEVGGFPAASELVSLENGLLHIRTRQLFAHDPRLFNQTAVPFTYNRDVPEPARWLTFLNELWPDDPEPIAALQEFFGYVLSGRTDQHKILLLVGPLRGGKGTIARILKDLIGKGNYAGPTLASLGTNFGMAPLIGRPLAIVSDARLGRGESNQVVERLLSISGEDVITVDIKYKEQWTGTLPTRFVIISNELPRFGDSSGAIATRFVTLVLTQSWLGKENTQLTNELREELPGILSWALDGLDRLNTGGKFTEPESSVDAMVALRDLVSPVSAFVRERCTVGPHEILVKDLYDAWKMWAEDNGHRAGSSQTFGRDLRAAQSHVRVRRPRDDEGHRDRYYAGITLTSKISTGQNDG
jgi:putative DNA primase/helicase